MLRLRRAPSHPVVVLLGLCLPFVFMAACSPRAPETGKHAIRPLFLANEGSSHIRDPGVDTRVFDPSQNNLSHWRLSRGKRHEKLSNKGTFNFNADNQNTSVFLKTSFAGFTTADSVAIHLELTSIDGNEYQKKGRKRLTRAEFGKLKLFKGSITFNWSSTHDRTKNTEHGSGSLTRELTLTDKMGKVFQFDFGDKPFFLGNLQHVSFELTFETPGQYKGSIISITFKRQSNSPFTRLSYYPRFDRIKRLNSPGGFTRSGYFFPQDTSYWTEVLPPGEAELEFYWSEYPEQQRGNDGEHNVSVKLKSGKDRVRDVYSDTTRKTRKKTGQWFHERIKLVIPDKPDNRLVFSASRLPTSFKERTTTRVAITVPILRYLNKQTPAPNIILVSIDTLRRDHLGCYGYPVHTSPEIDRFSKQAQLFRDVISPSPSTTPSHASILGSSYPADHGGLSNFHQLNLTAPTVAEHMLAQGYSTFAVTGGVAFSSDHNFYRGFQVFHDENDSVESLPGLFTPMVERAQENPFFGLYHTYEVHGKYKYRPMITELLSPDGFDAEFHDLPEEQKQESYKQLKHLNYLAALYDSGIRVTDLEFGNFVRYLHKRGLINNTILCFTSDHGEHLGEYNLMGHSNSLFRELLKVPLIILSPGNRGRISDQTCSLIDVAPTLLKEAGLAVPAWMKGKPVGLPGKQETQSPPFQPVYSTRFQSPDFFEHSLTGEEWKLMKDPQGERLVNRLGNSELEDKKGEQSETISTFRKLIQSFVRGTQQSTGQGEIDRLNRTRAKLEAMGYVE